MTDGTRRVGAIAPGLGTAGRAALTGLITALLLLTPASVLGFEISSYAFVNDDGSIRIKNRTFRLVGIYVPRTAYTCQRFTQPVNCASQTKIALEFKIGSKFVHCIGDGRNADGSYPAFCDVEGYDLGTYLIEQGFGIALPDAPFEYLMIERIARSRGMGVWAVPGQDLYRFPP
jgi:endonuclease YncB( thermonuclease family)